MDFLKKEDLKTLKYSYKLFSQKWYVYIVYENNNINFILNKDKYGYLLFMFGIPKNSLSENVTIEELILNNIVDYMSIYNSDIKKLESED